MRAPIQLDAWAGFLKCAYPTSKLDRSSRSDGATRVTIGTERCDEDHWVADYHVAAYQYLLAHQEEIKQAILELLLEEYQWLGPEIGCLEKDQENPFPEVSETNAFESMIGLGDISLLDIEKDGVGYIGFYFECTWGEREGVGIIIHKSRVIGMGDIEFSFQASNAYIDSLPEEEQREWEIRNRESDFSPFDLIRMAEKGI